MLEYDSNTIFVDMSGNNSVEIPLFTIFTVTLLFNAPAISS